jgi:hypothetical protein
MTPWTNNAFTCLNHFQHGRGKREVGEASLATEQGQIKRPRTVGEGATFEGKAPSTGRRE